MIELTGPAGAPDRLCAIVTNPTTVSAAASKKPATTIDGRGVRPSLALILDSCGLHLATSHAVFASCDCLANPSQLTCSGALGQAPDIDYPPCAKAGAAVMLAPVHVECR
jgi:hypothetical protein